jgi:hypothetical protein
LSLPSALTGSGSAGVTAVAEASAEAAVGVVATRGCEVDAGLGGCLSYSSLGTVHTRESAEMENGDSEMGGKKGDKGITYRAMAGEGLEERHVLLLPLFLLKQKFTNSQTQRPEDATQENRIRLDKVCGGWNNVRLSLCLAGQKKRTLAGGTSRKKGKRCK